MSEWKHKCKENIYIFGGKKKRKGDGKKLSGPMFQELVYINNFVQVS
jgi:hypothetical protein